MFLGWLENTSETEETARYAILAEKATLNHFREFLSNVDGKR